MGNSCFPPAGDGRTGSVAHLRPREGAHLRPADVLRTPGSPPFPSSSFLSSLELSGEGTLKKKKEENMVPFFLLRVLYYESRVEWRRRSLTSSRSSLALLTPHTPHSALYTPRPKLTSKGRCGLRSVDDLPFDFDFGKASQLRPREGPHLRAAGVLRPPGSAPASSSSVLLAST